MSTKMKKGILRPFRYISNMMDGKDAQEMQIGFPTDVKHVAHIGWDGPSVPNNNNAAGAPTWMKDYHSAPLDSASFRSDRGGSAASNPWASQEIVVDGGSLGDTSFRETQSEAGSMDITAGDSPPSPNTRRSRRHRSRGSAATSSMDCTGTEAGSEKKEKAKKSSRGKNRKKDKSDKSAAAGDDAAAAGATCQDLPAVPKKSNRRKNKGSSEGSGASAPAKDAGAAAEESAAPLPPAIEEAKD
ncbi:CRIB domain-containing protein RIC7-like [Oryza brachyantha]|uniref:CRIB domain-containing protein RIC7-like n=1 Tax=Oryza brachyantha TaxID=4533 RepID=UPI001AD9D754|nr:CRIB domain-containing protein RIC7-like [Oryza brachyantha]